MRRKYLIALIVNNFIIVFLARILFVVILHRNSILDENVVLVGRCRVRWCVGFGGETGYIKLALSLNIYIYIYIH